MKFKLYFFVSLVCNIVAGQTAPQVTPPTPEAAAIGKFVESPVSYFSGTPNISYPIYTISQDGVEVPISLSYNAKGIQVAEIASKVGTGWALNAGGLITRQIRGGADESQYGYLSNVNHSSNTFLLPGSAAARSANFANIDAENDPDLYLFNFLGFSGKFIIDDATRKAVVQSFDDLKIDVHFTGNEIDSFSISDTNGNVYFFGTIDRLADIETNTYLNSYNGDVSLSPGVDQRTAWYLSSIKTVTGSSINFTYTPLETRYTSITGRSSREYPVVAITYTKNNAWENKIDYISFDGGYVEFIYNNARLDLQGGKTLDEVKIYSKSTTTSNGNTSTDITLVKSYLLNYSYTTSTDDNSIIPPLVSYLDTFAPKRLFLNGISAVGRQPGSQIRETTSFEYNNLILPNRHSNNTDNWGYYNGQTNHHLKLYFDADRNINSTFAEAGMLKRINHPTGGWTEFTYEQNKVLVPSFYEELLIPFDRHHEKKKFRMSLQTSPHSTTMYFDSFFIEGTVNSPADVKIIFNQALNCNTNPAFSPDCYVVYLKHLESHTTTRLLRGQSKITLLPGHYTVNVIPNHNNHMFEMPTNPALIDDYLAQTFDVIIDYYSKTFDPNNDHITGGKRIRKIVKGENSTILLEKHYLYTKSDGKSSGKMHSLPPYFFIIDRVNNALLINGEHCQNPKPMGLFAGSEIGYSNVTEIAVGEEGNGRTEYTFTNTPDAGEYFRFPYHYPIDMSWARGKPVDIKNFDKNGVLVKHISNSYSFFNFKNLLPELTTYFLTEPGTGVLPSSKYLIDHEKAYIPMVRYGKFIHNFDEQLQPLTTPPDPNYYRLSYFVGGRANLFKTIVHTKQDNGTFTTTTNYFHDSTAHNQLTSQTAINSLGVTDEIQYVYAPEAIGAPERANLIAKNILVPLITKNLTNGAMTSIQKTNYRDWDPDNNPGQVLLMPEFIQTAKHSDQDLETKFSFKAVDALNGNPLEIEIENGITVSYLWGYNKTQPIAKIENATYAQIAAALSVTVETLKEYNEANINVIDGLRVAMPNAMITTYTYNQLVGPHTITDPRGYKTTYEYDSFNRLKLVRDHLQRILSENEYHYQTQN